MFFNKYNSFSKVDPKDLKKQVEAAYHHGNSGNETNPAVAALLAASKADVAAIMRVQLLLSYVDSNSKTHKHLRDNIDQENQWVKHHEKCLDATKRGYEKMMAASEKVRSEAFEAGKEDAEKRLKLVLQLKAANASKDAKQIDPKFQVKDGKDGNEPKQQQQQQHHHHKDKAPPVIINLDTLVVTKGKGKAKKYKPDAQFKQRPN